MESLENDSVKRLRQYLRIKAMHPNPSYDESISWIKEQAKEIGLSFNILYFQPPGEFAIWLTWEGSDPSLPSILLNSHIDVVAVDEAQWSHNPFEAFKDEDGNIYARGAQDMKSIGVEYLEAIRKLKKDNFTPLRTIHVSFVPDEETGGRKGMALFAKSKEFKSLNIGFALDEGIPSENSVLSVYYTERMICQIKVTAGGTTGHALLFHKNTAAEKIQQVIYKLMAFRASEESRLENNPNLTLGDVTTTNLTMLDGGLQINVMPPELYACFDIRVTPLKNSAEFLEFLRQICEETGVKFEFIFQTLEFNSVTPVDDSNKFWSSFKTTCEDMGLKIEPKICPGSTDMRYLRPSGISCFGFSPIYNTPILLHDNNEFINENMFSEGISIYENLIKNLSSLL